MRENEAGRARVPWRPSQIMSRLTSAGAHLSGAVLLAAGVANTLAARRDRSKDKHDDGDGKNIRDGEQDNRGDRDGDRDQDRAESREEHRDRREDRDVKREQTDDSSRNRSDRNRDRKNDETEDDTDSDVGAEQNNNNQNRNRDDEPDDDDGGGGGNNAGSAFFDSPLATKARRRANDFDNRARDEEEEGVFVDVDPEGESIYQTESISFATGPEGIEILTDNITYIAAPTPTPTPFPRPEFPERDGYPFGEDFPFGVARPEQTPTTAPTDPGDEPSDPGDSPPPQTDPIPAGPLPDDTDGGDNSMEFTS